MLNFGKCYKYLDRIQNGFWSCKKLLTYGRPVCLVIGKRSAGKSTNIACLALINYIVYGKKTIYCRRRMKDVQKTYKTFFDNAIVIVNQYAGLDKKIIAFKAYNGEYLIAFTRDEDENPIFESFGLYCALADEENMKSSSHSDCDIIIYDEFISKDKNKYLGTRDNIEAEWTALHSLYQTVDRGVGKTARNETILFLLANKATMFNPVCLTLGVSDYETFQKPKPGQKSKITAPKDACWVWEDIYDVDAAAEEEDSFAYRMATENIRKYAFENEGAENDEFIKRPKIAYYDRTVKLKGKLYGIYHDKDFQFYIDKPKEGYAILSLDAESHDHAVSYLIMKWDEDLTLQALSMAYRRGKCYFGDHKIKQAFLQYLEFID